MAYKVKLNQFEGPFDLLVYLIENARMSIYDIRVSEITSQYIKYIEKMQKLEINVATEFMVLAAALIEIKSKMLLPRTNIDGENLIEEDPRTQLVEKLLEYKKFKAISEMLVEREIYGRSIHEKPQEDLTGYTKEADEYLKLDIDKFVKAFNQFILKKKKETDMKRRYELKEKMRITSEAKIEFIKDMFRKDMSKEVDFYDLVEKKGNRFEVALAFSSILEMVKQKRIWADQKINFGEIRVGATENLETGVKEEMVNEQEVN